MTEHEALLGGQTGWAVEYATVRGGLQVADEGPHIDARVRELDGHHQPDMEGRGKRRHQPRVPGVVLVLLLRHHAQGQQRSSARHQARSSSSCLALADLPLLLHRGMDRTFLENINREVYQARGMHWMVLSENGEEGEDENVVLALEIEGLVDRQPIKRRMSLEYHVDQRLSSSTIL